MTKRSENTAPFVGILPAAGAAERLQPLAVAKELLPMGFRADDGTGLMRPVPIAEHAVRAMAAAGVRGCLMIVADHKTDLLRYFGNGGDFGTSIAYLNQPAPTGLTAAIEEANVWLGASNVCLALPDTVFEPQTAVRSVCERLVESGADVILGVFPTETPERFGPVRTRDDSDVVVEVLEKPTSSAMRNTWGVAAWTERFTRFLHDTRADLSGQSVSHVFNAAVQSGFDVRALHFPEGRYFDIGTADSLSSLVLPSTPSANA